MITLHFKGNGNISQKTDNMEVIRNRDTLFVTTYILHLRLKNFKKLCIISHADKLGNICKRLRFLLRSEIFSFVYNRIKTPKIQIFETRNSTSYKLDYFNKRFTVLHNRYFANIEIYFLYLL